MPEPTLFPGRPDTSTGVPVERHFCHALGCPIPVRPALLMCRWHWFMVPHELQKEVWRTYVAGQEIRKDPTTEYLIAARRAIDAVALREGRITQAQADEAIARLEALL